ncbi:hypothetical protein [Halocatena halophila]|uniref:hypothetical protein n=1 Tax=Halocatena halophila TaxID=2814576 RepID=UPI002ED09746
MNSNKKYSNERIIGHRVSADIEENNFTGIFADSDLEPQIPEYIVITESDIGVSEGSGWTKSVKLSPTELKDIYNLFFSEDE